MSRGMPVAVDIHETGSSPSGFKRGGIESGDLRRGERRRLVDPCVKGERSGAVRSSREFTGRQCVWRA